MQLKLPATFKILSIFFIFFGGITKAKVKTNHRNTNEKKKIRISITITSFKKIKVERYDGESKTGYFPEKKILRNLRADMYKSNHFFIEKFHIEHKPMAWDKKNNKYTSQMKFYKRYKNSFDVEEKIGTLKLSGNISKQGKFYHFDSNIKQKFTDKFNKPVLEVDIGFRKKKKLSFNDPRYPASKQQ